MIRTPAGGQRALPPQAGLSPSAAGKAAGWRRFPTYDLKRKREKLTITISYRGGPECWYEVHARGSRGRFPGYLAIHDVMRQIYNEG